MHELGGKHFDGEQSFSTAGRQHVAVMAEEVVRLVRACKPTLIVDATVGTGGHAERMLEETGAKLLGIDRDDAALCVAAERLGRFGTRVTLRQADFCDLDLMLEQTGNPVASAIVADLGMSSFALDDPKRGFSFGADGPLDMRMDRRQKLRAYDIVNEESEEELVRILCDLGEERAARRIAHAIVTVRRRHLLRTTGELATVIAGAVGGWRFGAINPATRTFQALRMAVNRELESLAELLDKAPQLLAVGGRLVMLAYHSLEDRPVKQRFRQLTKSQEFIAISRKAMRPDAEELANNRRARSAKLRCIERISS
ncbi:MAG: 16S rRNA (cytosine(1402)-N(4))-methyltransferase RsmH [Deltaproteobacteria bacterium]|nr:16S rRNA (cytosine(1402)-N(4))-methyltransferase RsmH [Deltaproteobacteria bacterium]